VPDFRLVAPFEPTGDQPAAIERLSGGVAGGLRHQTLLGVTGSGKTWTLANVIARANRPTLVLAHNKTLAAQLYAEFREFFPDNAVEYFVSYFDYYQPEAYLPRSDTYIEKDSSRNDEIDRLRHAATSALLSRRDVIVKDTPNFDKKKFLYYLSRSNYEHEWGTVYRKPGMGTRILAFFLKLIPKVGPFKAVNFKIPTKQTEDMYIKSVDATVENYALLLHQANDSKLDLPNRDCDTGRETRAGEYALTDKTYADLVDDLASKTSDPLNPALRDDLLHFYSDPNAPVATRKDAKAWQKLQDELEKLKQRAVSQAGEEPPVLNQ